MTLGYRNESRPLQDAGDNATVCLKMADGSKHYIRSILHTGEHEVQTLAYIGGTSGPFVNSTSAMHVLEPTAARFEIRAFSLDHQAEVDITGHHAAKHLRLEK